MSERNSGTILDGKYEILDRLAAGGMGEVWRARHVHLQELRVIKILRADRATDPHALQRFAQEARIATQIKHANVAILYDFSRLPDGSFYMVSEHIEGEDVGAWLRTRGVFPIALAIELGIQTLRGLEAIHAAGVIHRDISPDNMMITRDRRGRYQMKLIDLGLAKDLSVQAGLEITQAGMFMGKLMYCSPEQAGALRDEPIDHRSDLYSLATVLYEMISGKLPFDSENQHGFVFKRLTEPPLPLVGRNPAVSVPAEINAIILKGLERDRERRFPDALTFLQALVKVAEALRQVSTQEISIADTARKLPEATSSVRTSSRSGSGSELSREERSDLLAQIERAAKKVSESSRIAELATQAVQDGRYDDAAALVTQLESVSPRHPAVAQLKEQLADIGRGLQPRPASMAPRAAEPPLASRPPRATPVAPAPQGPSAADRERQERAAEGDRERRQKSEQAERERHQKAEAAERERIAKTDEAERLLKKYLTENKQSLAAFALETLLELAPQHQRRDLYQRAVRYMSEDKEKFEAARGVLAEGRDALLHGDLATAKKKLETLEKSDPTLELAESLRKELAEAEVEAKTAADLDRRRAHLEGLLEGKRLDEAERELQRLSASGLARVSVETYRLRISDIAALAEREAQGRDIEKRYRERVQVKDWLAARELALELERLMPDSPLPAELFHEISDLEGVHRKQQGIDQGVKQLETFLAQKRRGEAELALKILLQMDPEHPRRAEFTTRLASLAR
jgi:serine/threonine protein kinase